MPLLEDLLLRFRRVWAPPGPVVGQPGVPTDLAAGLDDELRDLSIELAAIAREGQGVVQAAEAEARSIIDAARTQSVRIVEAARIAAPEVRSSKAAAKIRDRRADIDRLIADAETAAGEITRRAQGRMPPLIERIVAEVLTEHPHEGEEEEEHARVVGGG